MTQFHVFRDEKRPEAAPLLVADHDDRVYRYVPNSKLWHHDPYLERLVDLNDSDWQITPVSRDEVPELLTQVAKYDGRGTSGQTLRKLRSQPPSDKVTSAEVGLPTPRNDRPIAGGDIRKLLEEIPAGTSRSVARYAVERKSVAINLAHEINTGKKKGLSLIALRARTQKAGDELLVEVCKLASHA